MATAQTDTSPDTPDMPQDVPQDMPSDMPPSISQPLWLSAGVLFGFFLLAATWSIFAEIATTIRVNGFFTSSRPAYELQHPEGGRLAAVLVAMHQSVQAGDRLFRFDVTSQIDLLAGLKDQTQNLEAENAVITRMLMGHERPLESGPASVVRFLAQYQHRLDSLQLRKMAQRQIAAAARDRIQTVTAALELLHQRRALLEEKSQANLALVARGFVSQADQDLLTDKILGLKGLHQEKRALLVSLQQTSRQAKADTALLQAEYFAQIAARYSSNIQQLADFRVQRLALEAEIRAAVVTAPISGRITTLEFDTPGMVAARGQTLATLAKPLETPRIELHILVANIDQISRQMTGKLTINGLPQRNAPELNVVITAVSPQAVRDTEGNPVYYLAEAEIPASDLAKAKAEMDLNLSADMPVSVAIQGRRVTFFRFLLAPFIALFEDAIQEA